MASVTIIPSPDGLTEAKRIRREYESLRRTMYDGSQAGDPAFFDELLGIALERTRLRNEARRLIERRLDAGMDAALGFDVSAKVRRQPVKVRAGRQRRSSVELAGQVLDLHERGVIVEAIADTLNVADRRVREILSRKISGSTMRVSGVQKGQVGTGVQLAAFGA